MDQFPEQEFVYDSSQNLPPPPSTGSSQGLEDNDFQHAHIILMMFNGLSRMPLVSYGAKPLK
jgi:hypothetical protein